MSDGKQAKKEQVYRKSEVEQHSSIETGCWVIYKNGVYDVTEFIVNHPGGKEKLLLAAGKDLEVFWCQPAFRQHYKSPLAHELLEEMRIGTLHPDDVRQEFVDPFRDEPTYPTNVIYDCIVVGAGVSGLQCARSLTTNHGLDLKNVLVLEAQDYIGGRVRQVTEFVKGVPIDVGAEFLHGSNTELTKFAQTSKEELREIFCWAHGDGGPLKEPVGNGYGLYFVGDKSGRRRLLRFDDADPDFQKLNETLWHLGELHEKDFGDNDSLADYLSKQGLSDEMIVMAQAGFSNTLCTTSEELSLKRCIQLCRLWHNEQEEDGDYTFKRSYKCLIDHLKQNLQIQTNSPVAKLQYQIETPVAPFSELVKVKTLGGATYYTKSLVITSSPHVLKSNLMQFDPPLSNEIVEALATTNMHNVVKVIMKFEKPCWPKNVHGMIISDSNFLLPEIWFRDVSETANKDEPAKAYAIGYTTSEYAKRVSSLSKKEVLKRCVDQLDEMFALLKQEHMSALKNDSSAESPSNLPKASEAYLGGMFWDWNPSHHPYIGGGYASPRAGTQAHLIDQMRLPYGNGNIFFAGEATNLPGATAHAALESGIRAAKQIADYLETKKE